MKESRRKPGTVYINDHPLYNMWCMIKQRCNNPNHTHYDLYGGKGVKVCDRWANSFTAFLEDVGKRPSPKHTIDRHPDKNGHYSPDNFRWATWSEQNSNRNPYGIITIREKRDMNYVAYFRKKKVGEKCDRGDLIAHVKEQYPTSEIVFI